MPCYEPLRACMVKGPEGPRLVFNRNAVGKALSLPCGRCIGCRLERSRQWAVRLVHENKMHESSCFLTLTYDEDHLPGDGSISVSACQDFMKRLRSRIAPIKVRFFLCGEYGEKLGRPHYHLILFGYDFPDKVKLEEKDGKILYSSEMLDDIWGNGGCRIGEVTFDSAAYVANYATKKITGAKAQEHYQGRKPEFLLMSRRPGIGRGFIERFMSDVYPSDEVIVKGREARPPRYYDQVLESRNPDLLAVLKLRREAAAEKLEEMVLKSKEIVHVAPGRNARRLAVRRRVTEAKLRLKSRKLEKS